MSAISSVNCWRIRLITERKMMDGRRYDEDLIIVAAVEEYAARHALTSEETVELFRKYDVFTVLRSEYAYLHTQPLTEGADFAENYIKRRGETE